MPNITVFLDEETYRRARIWAADRDTSVSAIVKCILVTLPARASSPQNRTPRTPLPPELVRPEPQSANLTTPPSSLPSQNPPATTPTAATVSSETSTPPAPAAKVTHIPAWGLTVLRAVLEHRHPTPRGQNRVRFDRETVNPPV
jgi:hypothetical protein